MFMNEVPNGAELSALVINELRDLYGIKYRKDKKHKNHHANGQTIFGVSLKELEHTEVQLSGGSYCRVPTFVHDACSLIKENVTIEGLFRKAGSSIRQKEIREKLENGFPLDESCNAIDIANILKYFFRELPEPLLPPGNFQESILRCLLCKGFAERKITAIQMVCLLLPTVNINTLAYFMQFLHFVSLHSATNKMSAKNLAIILTPGLMPITEHINQRLISHCQIIEILIENAHEIGIVPDSLLGRMQITTLSDTLCDPHNCTTVSSSTRRSMRLSLIDVPQTEIKKKKKRRSGSLTRMFNGIRKIVSSIGSAESLDKSVHEDTDILSTPCLTKTKKRKAHDSNIAAFSAKKKKDVMAMLPNGGILPSTPMCTKPIREKKSRLSLGVKRSTKNSTANHSKSSNSLVPSLERRWSIVGSSWSRKKDKNQSKQVSTENLTETTYNESDSWENFHLLQSHQSEPLMTVNEKLNSKADVEKENELVQITKSEYEEIKERVSAIETRISKEFIKIQSSIMNDSLDSVNIASHLNGPERVLKKFERTLEETEMMNATPTTEHLARRLSRDLKIRRSAEHKIIRSPSARKIGNIRRRSQENVRLTRNKSWHLGTADAVHNRNLVEKKISPLQETTKTNKTPEILPAPHLKSSLKRGRPNTLQSGLHKNASVVPKKNDEHVLKIFVPASSKNMHTDLHNEKWISANIFFDDSKTNKLAPSKGTTSKALKMKIGPKKLNMDECMEVSTPAISAVVNYPSGRTPQSANSVTIIESNTRTPMLPPRLPVIKKTPGSMLKTPHSHLPATRSHLTPLWQQEQQQMGGRASIARLRSQNAGMVMAKAKLFDEVVIEPKMTKAKVSQTRKSVNNNENTGQSKANTKTNSGGRKNAAISNIARRTQSTNYKNSQIPRSSRNTPNKKSPAAMIGAVLLLNDNHFSNSPITRRMAAMDSTPQMKRQIINKNPRRLVRTPQGRKNA